VEGDPDVGLPVDRERFPRLLLKRQHLRACPGHQNDRRRLIAVDEAGRCRSVGGIGDLRLDVPGSIRQLRKGGGRAGHGHNRGAGLSEGGRDPAAQPAARADDDRGLA
jgi:hypothetical protein